MISRNLSRLITFDVTGTLLMPKLEHYVKIGRQHGLQIDSRRLAQSFKSNFARLAVEHPIYGRHTGLGWKNWWRIVVYNIFIDQHPLVSKDKLDKIADSLINCYSTSQCWYIYPGVVELLDFLYKQDIILGVISNFDQRLESILEEAEIRKYFSFVLTSYDFGAEKPNLLIFEEAIKLVKCLRGEKILPQEALHIGDKIDNDYFGAKNAGWNALLVKYSGDKINENKVLREHVFTSLKELREYFEKLVGTNYVSQ